MDLDENTTSVLPHPNMDRELYASTMRAVIPENFQELEESAERLGHALDRLGEQSTPLPRYVRDAYKKGIPSQGYQDFPEAPKLGEVFSQSTKDPGIDQSHKPGQSVESMFGTPETRSRGRMERALDELEKAPARIERALQRIPGT